MNQNLFSRRYRIVRDHYAGYEVQVWRWWWPFWVEAGPGCNTHATIERAEEFARRHSQYSVKYLGTLQPEPIGRDSELAALRKLAGLK